MASASSAVPVRRWNRWWTQGAGVWTVGAVSLATSVTMLAAAVAGHAPVGVAIVAGCAAVLATLGVIDTQTRTIPNVIVVPALGVALAVALVHPERSFGGAAGAAAFAGGLYAVAFFVRPSSIFKGRLAVPPARRSGADGARWGGVAGAIAVLVAGLAQAELPVAGAVAAAAVAGCPFLPSFFVGRCNLGEDASGARGMGGGDVKLAALLGAVAGFPAVLAVLPVAVFGGAVAALTVAFVQRGGGAIPYGPFLAAGAVLALV